MVYLNRLVENPPVDFQTAIEQTENPRRVRTEDKSSNPQPDAKTTHSGCVFVLVKLFLSSKHATHIRRTRGKIQRFQLLRAVKVQDRIARKMYQQNGCCLHPTGVNDP